MVALGVSDWFRGMMSLAILLMSTSVQAKLGANGRVVNSSSREESRVPMSRFSLVKINGKVLGHNTLPPWSGCGNAKRAIRVNR